MVSISLGIQNCALMSYVPAVVAYPASAVSVKFLPCWVWFWMKAVASKLVCGTGRLKMPVRAEIVTGTVRLVHDLAAAEAAKTASAKAELANMSKVVQGSRFATQGLLFFQLSRMVPPGALR